MISLSINQMVYSRKRKYSSFKSGARSGALRGRYLRSSLKGFGARTGRRVPNIAKRVRRIERTIETKEGRIVFPSGTNIGLPHNNMVIIRDDLIYSFNGNADPMAGNPQRIGDKITIKGLKIKLFIQNQAQRPRVYYRFMVVKHAKGDVPSRATLFKGLCGNKMLDVVNTERYTILKQQIVTVQTGPAHAWTTASVPGGYPESGNNASTIVGGVGTKIIDMWIPGRKFGRGGVVQYENESSQPKFFNYTLVCLAYDWFGTPQDINNVGAVSDGFVNMHYQDA